MQTWGRIETGIDFISEWSGRLGWMIVLYAMVFGLSDVILRYVFNLPSLWISITIQYAIVLLACVSGPYALNNRAFVKLDVFYERFPPRVKAICDIITFAITFIYLYVLITRGIDLAISSFGRNEMTPTAVQIPLYHLKAIIPLAAFCTMLVAIKKLGQDIQTVVKYKKE